MKVVIKKKMFALCVAILPSLVFAEPEHKKDIGEKQVASTEKTNSVADYASKASESNDDNILVVQSREGKPIVGIDGKKLTAKKVYK